MLKLKIYMLCACFSGSVLVVFFLYSFSKQSENNPNGFIRELPPHKLVGIDFKDIKYNSWYFSGHIDDSVFLGNYNNPYKMLKINPNLKNSGVISLTGLENIQLFKGTSIMLDATEIYVMDGLKPMILIGKSSGLGISKRFESNYFTAAIPLTKSSVAIRYVNQKYENVLAKLTIGLDSSRTSQLLEKQVDGMFCTDGEMVKIPGSSKMIYLYYYRNQFLCADSNLNLLYKGKTIDTVSHAQIKVGRIKSSGQITMAAPPLYVNKRASANEKYLFVQSALRANNETDYMIKNVSMIDVYAIKDGKYQFTFYLPDFRGNKIRDFRVYGQSLYALYDHYLYKYQLNF